MTVHGYADTDETYGFRQVEYKAIQHVPLFRDAWVLSFRGKVDTTFASDDQAIPFFMLPALGGGIQPARLHQLALPHRNSILLQAEWRVLVNSFFDTAVFADAGKVTSRTSDLDLSRLKNDYGIGFRVHGPAATPLRIEFAKSNEGLSLVFSAQAAF